MSCINAMSPSTILNKYDKIKNIYSFKQSLFEVRLGLFCIENRKHSAKELIFYLEQVMLFLCALWELLHTGV